MFYNQLLINGNVSPIETYKIPNKDLIEYYQFKLHNTNVSELNFNNKILFNAKIKCINWFEFKYNKFLKFNILKARNVTTLETYFFQFVYYNYMIYTKNDIENNDYLKEIYEISKHSSLIHDIKSYVIEDGKVIQVQHYDTLLSFSEYCINIDNIIKNINKTIKSDFIILQTNFPQNRELSSCENTYNNFRFFTLLNNIIPAGIYDIKNIEIYKLNNKDNIFLVKDETILEFFKNYTEINQEVDQYYLSFDLESEVNRNLKIDSEKNILTHCGVEYFNTSYYNNYAPDSCIQFCLVNLDYHYKKILSKSFNEDDISYESLIKNYFTNKKIKNIIELEKNKILNDEKCLFIETKPDNIKLIFNRIKDNKKKYVFMKEKHMIEFFFTLLKILCVDVILSYNGHSYDFPQIFKRYAYLCNKTISKEYSLPSLYNMQSIKYTESNNDATNFNIKNLIIEAPYYSVDIFNYVKKFYPSLSSYSLKEVSKNMYTIEALCIPNIIDKDTYTIIPIITDYNIKDFLSVLLTSNYCYINDISYKILDKNNIFDYNSLNVDNVLNNYKIFDNNLKYLNGSFIIKILNKDTINSVINNDIKFNFTKYKDYIVKIQLSKDDVPIYSISALLDQDTYDIANYCIHDTVLCRHLFKSYNIKNNIDIFTNLYYLPQNKSLLYRNTTNIQGYILKISLKEKTFYKKSNKFYLEKYTGGKVLSPKKKFNKEPVLIYDFESLYPSIMINYNISPDKLVLVLDLKDKLEYELIRKDIQEKFNIDHYTIIYINTENSYIITVFTKINENYEYCKGLLCIMLSEFKKLRTEYKNKVKYYKENNNEFMVKNCDLMQNNIKIFANSLYGNLGSSFSNLSCKYTSQSITAKGGDFIMFLDQMLHNAKINNKKIYLNLNNIKDFHTVYDNNGKIYNPFIEKYINISENYDFEFDHDVNLEVIYGDTDSIMIIPTNINTHKNVYDTKNEIYIKQIVNLISNFGTILHKFIKNNLIINNKLNLEFENIILNMILQSKKKYTGLAIEPYSKKIIYKEINKGISIKRRDICEYQRKIIIKIYKFLNDLIVSNRFTDFNITDEFIIVNIWSFIDKEIKILIKNFLKNKLNISEFLITCSYTDNYKDENNHVSILINNYNKTARNLILKGDRFDYMYVIDFDNNKCNLDNINYENNKIHKIINWQIIDSKINDYKVIYETGLNMTNKRIALEIYVHKILLNIVSIFNESSVIKKKLLLNYKLNYS